jgi:hypothetical protein
MNIMKKQLHLLIFLMMFSLMVSSQTLVNEDFSGGNMPPAGWTIDAHAANWSNVTTQNAGGTAPEARFFYSPSFNEASRLISPEINTNGFTSLTLSFRHFLDDYSGTAYSLGVATRASNGPWNNAWTVSPTGDIGPELKVIEITTNDVGSANFQFCIFFNGNSYNLDNWFIDEIQLMVSVDNDAAMATIDVPRFSEGVNVPVNGAFLNMGLDPVITCDIYYQIDDGTPVMESLSGMNLGLGDSQNFTFEDPLNLEPGDYMMKMWTANVNGAGPDENPANDTATLDLHVASQSVARRPLFEEFTSSTCGPCASFNSGTFNPFVEDHGDEITLVKYQMDWPGSGDPYYTDEGGVRRQYYGVSYVPDLYTDGMQTPTNSGGVNNAFNNSMDEPAFMDLSAYHVIEGDNITVHLDIMSHIGGEAVAYIVVFENVTTGNTGSNGETEFHHVMMKMIPDANGTVVNLVDGEVTSVEGSADMSLTFVEEMDDLGVAVIVQEASSKMIFQSAYSVESMVGLGEGNKTDELIAYPNPSSGLVKLSRTLEDVDITVMNVYGQKITGITGYSGNVIDLGDLGTGNYILRMDGPGLHEVKAISIIK